METDQASGILISPSGEAFTSPLFLLFAVITQGQKIASSEKNLNVTYTLPKKSALTSETALSCNDLGVEYCDRPLDLWISPDPARQYNSPYTYCGDNPVNCIDKDGKVGSTSTTHLSNYYLGANLEPGNLQVRLYLDFSVTLGGKTKIGILEVSATFMSETDSYLPELDQSFSQGFELSIPFLKNYGLGIDVSRSSDTQAGVQNAPWSRQFLGSQNSTSVSAGANEPVRIGLGLALPLGGMEAGLEFSPRKG